MERRAAQRMVQVMAKADDWAHAVMGAECWGLVRVLSWELPADEYPVLRGAMDAQVPEVGCRSVAPARAAVTLLPSAQSYHPSCEG